MNKEAGKAERSEKLTKAGLVKDETLPFVSQMITIFNDAKRRTLCAWSWPSREIAHQKVQITFLMDVLESLNQKLNICDTLLQ